ncbi:MAG TPA: M48 family metalloprotease, partial [Polyangiaceae bacterium]|nr:M48 family metalloprotease [Polyangiaceae bacterium]
VRWVSPGLTLSLGLGMFVVGNELVWRMAVRAIGRAKTQHWSERARSFFAWRSVVTGWHVSMVVGICLVDQALALHDTIGSTLRLALVASVLSVLLAAPRSSHWSARITGIQRPRSTWRAAAAFHCVYLSSLWIVMFFCVAVPTRYDARGVAWALLLVLALLGNGLGVGVRLLAVVGLLTPARGQVVEAVAMARRDLPSPGPEVRVFEVELNNANALAYPAAQIVVFSAAAVDGLTPAQLTAIAGHELAHLDESRALRMQRAAWGLSYALPLLFIPLLPRAPAIGFAFGVVLFLLSTFAYRSLSLRLEEHADRAAAHHGQGEGSYASALERIYELNLIPAVTSTRQTHPHLYDRLIASGASPAFPRPRPPPIWPSLLSAVLVVLCSATLAVAQISLTSRLAAHLDLRKESQLNWAVALQGKHADWLTIAGHWLAQDRLREANLALNFTKYRAGLPRQVLRAGLAARRGDCSQVTRLLAGTGLAGCREGDCVARLVRRCNGRCYGVISEYLHLQELCPLEPSTLPEEHR